MEKDFVYFFLVFTLAINIIGFFVVSKGMFKNLKTLFLEDETWDWKSILYSLFISIVAGAMWMPVIFIGMMKKNNDGEENDG